MQLQTRQFGTIEVNEQDILYFPSGIPGFENTKRFTLLRNQETEIPFFWLQGVDDPNLAFVVTDPFSIRDGYFVDVEDEEVEEIQVRDPEKILTLAIVTIPDNIKKISVNLKAPVLINMENNKGKQVMMKEEIFPVKYYIMAGDRE